MAAFRQQFGEGRTREPGSSDFGGKNGFFDRLLENPQNPLGWSVKLFTVWGVTVRLHLMTAVYLIGLLLWSIPFSHSGFVFLAPSVPVLFALILAHELGHCFACRLVGGEADRVVMLPWGGLALTRPPDQWRPHLITAAGGPAVQLLLIPVTVVALYAFGMGNIVLFNPLDPTSALALIPASATTFALVAKVTLWWIHAINLILLGFNLLLPIYPFDAGRIIHAVLWSRMGYRRASEAAVLIGFAGALVLGVVALFTENVMLVLIAVFGAASCWLERRRLRGEIDVAGEGLGVGAANPEDDEDRESRAEVRARQEAEREQAELDRLLAKIAAEGIESLSRGDRKILDQISKKKRGG